MAAEGPPGGVELVKPVAGIDPALAVSVTTVGSPVTTLRELVCEEKDTSPFI